MRVHRDIMGSFVLGAGLALAGSADGAVVLVSQQREIQAKNSTIRSASDNSTAEWGASKVWYQSGTNGYWNGAAQYSTFLPDGSTALGESIYADGSTRSERMGSGGPAAGSTWTASSVFEFVFSVSESQFINIFATTEWTGSGLVQASLVNDGTGAGVWNLTGQGNENVLQTLAVGTYRFRVEASSSLDSAGNGGDSLFTFGIGFTPVPGPSALCLVAASAFLRRRRT